MGLNHGTSGTAVLRKYDLEQYIVYLSCQSVVNGFVPCYKKIFKQAKEESRRFFVDEHSAGPWRTIYGYAKKSQVTALGKLVSLCH